MINLSDFAFPALGPNLPCVPVPPRPSPTQTTPLPMAICSYLVHTDDDPARLAERLRALPGCDALPSTNRKLVVLVTETGSAADDEELRRRVTSLPGVKSLVMTFGEMDPEVAPRPEHESRS